MGDGKGSAEDNEPFQTLELRTDAGIGTGASSPGLELTVYVLDVAQVPLISLDSVEKAAQRINSRLDFRTCSGTNTASIKLSLPGKPDLILRARQERGSPAMREELALDGRLVLSEKGTKILILDTGAQANVMSPEFAHMLVRRRPPPADLRLFGAGDSRLVVIEMGTLIIMLAPFTNPRAELGVLPKRAIQLLRAQSGFRVRMVSDRTQRVDHHAASWQGPLCRLGRRRRLARDAACQSRLLRQV